jgi:hypothetical protein
MPNMMKSSHKKHEIKGKGNVITEFVKKKTIELSKGEKTLLARERKELKERFFFICFAHFFFFKG